MQRNVRSIDVGYGNNKYTISGNQGKTRPKCDMFPSVAPLAAAVSLSASMGLKTRTVQVEVDQVTYEVGHDALLVQGGTSYSRSLDSDYCLRPNYRALVGGALHYMDVSRIDLLVLGLPMTTFLSHKDRLAELMARTHVIGSKEVEVVRCKVIPQAYGGYLEHTINKDKLKKAEEMTTLIIDPGYHTLDWIVCTGFKFDDRRSGALADAGMCSYLKSIGDRLAAEIKEDIGDVSRIDAALRTEERLVRLYGKEHKLDDYPTYGQQTAQEAINTLADRLGSLADIDEVIVVGGASVHFIDAVRSRFSRHQVEVADDPIYANVRGFQAWGEAQVERMADDI